MAVPTDTGLAADVRERGHIGLLVLGSIASGLALGLLLVLAVFGGGEEAEITGSALLALGAGFMLLAIGSERFMAARLGVVPAPPLANASSPAPVFSNAP